ncbi:hypothetical protein ACFVVQ_12145 [Paenibacillus chitinolyticus]|uniref:hypothetical protein n=1 Tax=Paenibacillus chitinolyticus TaxID=79263 RepID=UPI0036DE6B58
MADLNLPRVEQGMTVEQLGQIIGRVIKELNYLMDGMLGNENIRVKSIQADRIDVNKLSAISADLGHITAGLIEAIKMIGSTIIGSYIATSEYSFPKIEFSSVGTLLKASTTANNFMKIDPAFFESPSLEWDSPNLKLSMGIYQNRFLINTLSGDVQIGSSFGSLYLSASNGYVRVPDWARFMNSGNGRTLQSELDSLSARISALESRPYYPPPST